MQSPSHQPRAIALLLGATVLLSLGGCRSQHVRARDLQASLRAAPGAGRQQIQFAGLSSSGTGSAVVGPADLLAVQVLSGIEEETPEPLMLRVDESGAVDVPLVGPVAVAGVEPVEAARRITAASVQRGIYTRPQVSVRVEEPATHRITVLGAVNEPGTKEVPRSACDLLTAVALAGGFTDDAGAVVEVLYHDPTLGVAAADATDDGAIQQVSYAAPSARSERIDLADPNSRARAQRSLSDRDVVVVRPREERVVHVSGLVNTPGQVELSDDHDTRVLDAIATAGGVSSNVADKVIVIRHRDAGSDPVVVRVSISEAKRNGAENLRLQSGDLVSVEPTVATTFVETFNNLFRITMGVGGNLTLF